MMAEEQRPTPRKLSVELSEEQLGELGPIVKATGRVKIAGTLEDGRLSVSHIACNAPFIACNAPFLACNSPFKSESDS
jgi:hypothetical protein